MPIQPRIVAQNGHLIFYAAEHKNISFQTLGRGGIHVNGVDLLKTSKLSNSVLESIKKYEASSQRSLAKISEFEQLLDDGILAKIKTIQWGPNVTSTSNQFPQVPVNSGSVVRSVRRLNRKVNNLQKSIRLLTLLLTTDECSSNPCKNGATCQDLFNDYLCQCPNEWEGPLCDKDVNECARFAGTDLGCQNGATCINRPGTYECMCPHGWFGIHCTRRSNDCKSGSNAELCGHGTCVTQYNDVGYKCICDQGWTTDGKTPACNTDVNECTMNKPPCSVNPPVPCINLPGTFHCGNCPQGYTGNGYYCTDLDECATSNGGCSTNPMVQCINTLGSRSCGNCPAGYTGDGVICSYQGVCSVNNGGCHSLATCRNNPRISSTFVECVCPAGYAGNGIGPNGCVRSLLPDQGPCYPNPCRHGMCRLNGTSDYVCECYSRYTGRNCDSFRDLCATNPCQNGGTCTSILGISYRCVCPSSYTGFRCETERQACGGQLTSENGTLAFPSVQFQAYGHALSCAWTIETNVTKVLNVTFLSFSVEESPACRYDWLQIHDGKNTLSRSIGRFCGHNLPNGGTIITTHNVVYLWFRSDHSVASRGFNLTWTSIVPYCGEELKEVTSHGNIHSPGSPGNYPNNRDCYWPLEAPAGKRLLFHFFSLMIGNSSTCDNDYLEFISGTEYSDPVFAKFCNTTHPTPLFSPGAEVLVHFHTDASRTYPGFQITYSVVEGMPGCGGVYTRYQDEIRSPSFNGNYPNDIQCEYKIQLSEKSRIKLTFLSFDLEEAEGCQFDYVAIYSGGTVDAPLIGTYCGSEVPAPYIVDNNVLLIVFKTDWATTSSGFVIRYETVCGGKFTAPSGVVSSPGYPNKYDHSLQCIYEIIQPLGRVIKLKIEDLDLESNSYPECVYDYLEVRDGHDANSTLVGTYCEEVPPLIVSSYNYLWLKFESDSNNNGRGFKANYTTSNLGCGGILKEKTGTFSTPSYPDLYPGDQTCKWIISAPPGNIIQLMWMNFQLERSHECMYDYVEVFDNNTETGEGSSIGKFCGQTIPATLLSTSNLVTVNFHSDPTQHLSGFLATYNIILEANVCGGNYFTDAGTLKSPGYPENYPLNMECTWTIQVKPGHQILLNVIDFSMESYSVCRYDWLEIRNGGSAVSPLLGKFCGTNIPKSIPSHANKVYINFRSDMTKSERGFKIKWEATATGCGGSLSSPTGSIISPNYPEPYSVHTDCIWKIAVSTGSLIQAVFSDLDLEEHSECQLDYVEILDGPSLNSKSLGRFCTSHPSFIRSTSNSLTVRFRSDLSRNGRGFQLQYTTMCNNTLKGFRGVIESPNFPNSYPGSINCNWEIKVAERNNINISFSHFDLERIAPDHSAYSDNKCIYDYLEIFYIEPVQEYEEEGPFQKYGVYCGTDDPPLITLKSNHAKIHFVSDNLITGNGFRLEWQIEGCGDILTRPNGTISSPNYPNAYPPSVECNWQIQADFGQHIEITFHKIELEKTYTCHLDYINLYNGEDDTYPIIASVCHQDKPITLRSSGNMMYIKFKADSSVQGIGFIANYTTKATKCGGKYIADKATIMSPNYPQNYEVNDTCSYQIEIGEGHMISLKFEDFDLFTPDGVNCGSNNNSFVKVYDGPTIDYPILAKVCGKDAPNHTIISTTNKMYVEMVTQTDVVAKGFLANYKRTCGARIETDGTGYIRLNPNDLDYEEFNCSWTIVSKDPSKHVSLTITHLDTMSSYCDESFNALKIYNGASSDAPLLGSYCGTKSPPTLTTDGSAMHIDIEYNSVLFATYSIFDNHCGGTLTSVEGIFASPGYPKKYPMETECEWTIDIPEGNHLSVTFTYFELLESEHCNTDYLEVRQSNGTGKLLGTYCGDDLPLNITNMGSLWFFLKTSLMDGDLSAITAKGFQAEYILNHENDLTGHSGRIVSPLYNQGHPLYGDYSWRITVNYGKRILLTFKEINLESGDSMCFSAITIYDGSSDTDALINEYCGTSLPKDIKSTSNILFIKFRGYSTARYITRFILEWLEIDAITPKIDQIPNVKGCGTSEPVNINGLKNFTKITSPGYPNGYERNLNCEWIFTTISMNRVAIYFTDMDLQPSYGSSCYGDYIEVFEKKTADWQSVIKTCHENVTSRSFIYTSNMMKVIFKTDNYGNRTGFAAFVREACGGYLTEPTSYIVYDNNTRQSLLPRHSATCQWNITVGAGKTIEIEFLQFDILHDKEKGCNNYLMIRNGIFSDSPILGDGKYCGDQLPSILKTTGNNAYIKYQGQSSAANFKMRYREVSYACGGEITLNQFENVTEISSPNYPQIPPPHIECVWRIIAPPGEIIRIDFPFRFDVTNDKECNKEYVEIRDGATIYSKLIGKFCGNKPNSQFTTNNMMFVKFFTQLTDPSNGFKAKLTLAYCGGTVNGKMGQIRSPYFNNPSKYPVGANCTWHLVSPLDHSMNIKFNKIDLEESFGCTSDHVWIYEENQVDNTKTTLGKFCGKKLPSEVNSAGNEVLVNFLTNQVKKDFSGFSLNFNSSREVCGGVIEAAEGTIQSPGYPAPHETLRRCGWYVKVPRGRRVTVNIEDFGLDNRLLATWINGLAFYNENSFRSFLKKISSNNEKTVESSENHMFIYYWSSGKTGRGFKLKFSSNEPTRCQGDLNEDSGTITQPNIPYPYFCTYIRNQQYQGKTFAMTITTTTNNTNPGGKTSCSQYLATIKVESDEAKSPLQTIQCVPSTTVVRSPYSNLKLTFMQTTSRSTANYTMSYNTYKCGGVISSETGVIRSPGYPNKYSSSIECAWLLKLPEEQTILLTFENLDLGDNCAKSYLDIYNGNSPSSPKIDRYCQNNKPDSIRSESNILWIEYKYDQESNGKGFSLKYEPKIQGCGGLFHSQNRIIQTPSFPDDYPNNAECLWELRSDEGYHIGLTFMTRFQIEQSDNCENDFVEIWDWRNDEWFSLGKKCGREIPESINATSNRMKILFRSNERIGGKGFRAKWEWNCGGTFIADATERFIVSPGYPLLYKKNMRCEYNISSKNPSQYVNIKFYQFQLEGMGSNCRFDNLTINNYISGIRYVHIASMYRQVFCGQRIPPNIRLANKIYILFQTDAWVQKSGFRFSYQLDTCGGEIKSARVINSPPMNIEKTPGLYHGYLNCVWNITGPPKKMVVVNFQEFNFDYRRNCYFDNVEIYEGSALLRSKRIANLCGNLNKNLPSIKSENNTVLIVLKADRTANHAGFKAEVYFADGPASGCGGKIKLNGSVAATLTAPDLSDMDCFWTIQSDIGTTIKLHFDEFKLPTTCGSSNHTFRNCSCGYLELRDGHPSVAEIIEKFCGLTSTSFARELSSTSNSMGIRLFTRGIVRRSFKITLKATPSICGPIYLNATKDIQTIVSPGYPNKYPSDIKCAWIIKNNNGYGKFVVRFVDFDLNEENNQHIVNNVCNEDKVEIIDETVSAAELIISFFFVNK
ncbi:hypothetical protein Zmor_011346 [Zophobas morio]|uniref:Cubilin n=1 Tax=Zophobas morio TaxID=2755281 RepID=A0AA38IQY5_9CUCU|nr:hypothetical protein Zmor_011346 [Zophobas morio]